MCTKCKLRSDNRPFWTPMIIKENWSWGNEILLIAYLRWPENDSDCTKYMACIDLEQLRRSDTAWLRSLHYARLPDDVLRRFERASSMMHGTYGERRLAPIVSGRWSTLPSIRKKRGDRDTYGAKNFEAVEILINVFVANAQAHLPIFLYKFAMQTSTWQGFLLLQPCIIYCSMFLVVSIPWSFRPSSRQASQFSLSSALWIAQYPSFVKC